MRDPWGRTKGSGAYIVDDILIKAETPLMFEEIEKDVQKEIATYNGLMPHLQQLRKQGLVEKTTDDLWRVTKLGRDVWDGKEDCPPR